MLRKENQVLIHDALEIVTHVHEIIFTLGKTDPRGAGDPDLTPR
jgi:hypothetical protein